MRKFELKITIYDWFFITTVAILFSSVISIIIYKILNSGFLNGLFTGSLLGLILALYSIGLISINNKYILPRIGKPFIWWIISAIFAFLAGYLGFYSTFIIVDSFNIDIPKKILENWHMLALSTGFLNYLMGLIIYLFVSMKAKKQELENLLIEGRLISLSTQLNSHFLHNILNNIAELIRIDKVKAEEALIKLGRFLRKALNEKQVVFVSEELENVRTYVELENLRYDGLIKLNVTNEKNFYDILIPRFSIQLIVENAIKHGFLGKVLNIDICFESLDSFIVIRISNDGKEIDNIKFGTGLLNLYRRLKLLCNGKLEFGKMKKNEFVIKLPK